MPQYTTPPWYAQLNTVLQQDPKKTGFLGFLVLILLVVSVRMMISSARPATAAGALVIPVAGTASPLVPSQVLRPGSVAASLRVWLNTPIPRLARNDFLVKSDYSPRDTTKTSPASSPGTFWAALEKSLSVQADQKAKHDAAITNLKAQAAAIRPTSTVMGPSPRAMVNGVLVAEGDFVASFRVVKIEARGMIVERDGVRLVIPMN